jgi:hypothetical protein
MLNVPDFVGEEAGFEPIVAFSGFGAPCRVEEGGVSERCAA